MPEPKRAPADLGTSRRPLVDAALCLVVFVASYTVFRMAPVHHHFEQLGWPEQKIVVRFWIVSAILGLVALSSLKLR